MFYGGGQGAGDNKGKCAHFLCFYHCSGVSLKPFLHRRRINSCQRISHCPVRCLVTYLLSKLLFACSDLFIKPRYFFPFLLEIKQHLNAYKAVRGCIHLSKPARISVCVCCILYSDRGCTAHVPRTEVQPTAQEYMCLHESRSRTKLSNVDPLDQSAAA